MIRVLSLCAVLAIPAGAAQAQADGVPGPGHYCLRTPIGSFEADEAPADDDDKLGGNAVAESQGVGLLGADVDVEVREGKVFVAFSNYMPDNNQIVRTAAVPARPSVSGGVEFDFVDNWGAAGRGVLKRLGDGVELDIVRTGEADSFAGRYASRQYGNFHLNPGVCAPYR